ncbi:hypothetical protein FRC0543_00006 [Corynebacterium diphtheriae]|nr:hypothetical protein FRC0409_00006 [Corynebacterium diphtheriae]CAB0923994.1 hypothetical protein FRC0432_00007 [Corynebacterium diphtheriae]CAB0954531.1 hypothetical protein FRC0470_01211 [Corynebacterium diphtheriae]CAB1027137.1 hypothetical protein FRC0544_00006 [Corynebacterium diphtheriae]CAB1027155.1 hypothetical protein FRC0543_00006 [Corynebacterium diphtheriae]
MGWVPAHSLAHQFTTFLYDMNQNNNEIQVKVNPHKGGTVQGVSYFLEFSTVALSVLLSNLTLHVFHVQALHLSDQVF